MRLKSIIVFLALLLPACVYAEVTVAQLKFERDSLSKVLKSLRKSNQEKFKNFGVELEKINERHEFVLDSLKKDYDQKVAEGEQQKKNDEETIADLNRQISELEDMSQMADALQKQQDELDRLSIKPEVGADSKWDNLAFADIDRALLSRVVQSYKQFATNDKKFKGTYDNFVILQQECAIYDNGNKVLKSPYDSKMVKDSSSEVSTLLSKAKPARKQELRELNNLLSSYPWVVKMFQSVIEKVEEVQSSADKKDMSKVAIAAINQIEQEDGFISAIKDIPWLSDQYVIYYDELGNNRPSNEIAVRETIMNLKP